MRVPRLRGAAGLVGGGRGKPGTHQLRQGAVGRPDGSCGAAGTRSCLGGATPGGTALPWVGPAAPRRRLVPPARTMNRSLGASSSALRSLLMPGSPASPPAVSPAAHGEGWTSSGTPRQRHGAPRAGWLGCPAAPLAHGDRHRGCRWHPGTHGSPGTAAPRAHPVRPGHPLARCLLSHSPLPSLGHAVPSPPTQRAPTAGEGRRVGGQHRPWSPLPQLCSGAQEWGAQFPTPPAPQSSPPGDRVLEPQQ